MGERQPPAPADIALVLDRASVRLHDAAKAALRGSDLTIEQWRVLDHLARTGGATMTEIGAAALIVGPTATRVVDRLVDRALVYRDLDAVDRRRVLVRPSERGSRLHGQVASGVTKATADALTALDKREIAALTGLLERLAAGPVPAPSPAAG